MGASPAYRTKAFISYSHKDKPYLERLQAHLKPFIRESSIKVWDDTQIQPGTDWKAAIERGLAEAQVVILLVSADFLASDFIAEKELPKILLAAQQEGVTILPVILGHCVYRRVRLGQLQSVNDPANPLESLPKHEQDKIWSQVAERTLDALKAKEQEWSEKAKSLFDAGKYGEALEACEHLLRFNPDDAFTLRYKGAILYHRGQYKAGLDALEQVIQFNSNNAFAHKYKVFALYSLGRYKESLTAAEVAVKLDSRDGYLFQIRGQTLFFLEQYEEALAALEQAPKAPGGYVDVFSYKGAALFYLQRYKEALAALEEALKSGWNGDAFTHKYMGAVLFHLQRYKEGMVALEKAFQGDVFTCKYKGATLFHLGREVEALAALERAFQLDPDDAFTNKYKGATFVNLEQENEALDALEQALKAEPNDAFTLRYQGVALLGLRRYEEALGVFEQALKLEPGDAFALRLKSKIEKILVYRKRLAETTARTESTTQVEKKRSGIDESVASRPTEGYTEPRLIVPQWLKSMELNQNQEGEKAEGQSEEGDNKQRFSYSLPFENEEDMRLHESVERWWQRWRQQS